MKELTIENLDKVAKKEKGLYIIKFSSPTCGPCSTMKPVIEELDKRNPEITIYEADTSKSPELAQHFGIRGVPTINFCRRREILYSFTGVTPLGNMQYVIDNIDDPYFVEHGEFQKQIMKKSLFFPLLVGGIVLVLLLLVIFL